MGVFPASFTRQLTLYDASLTFSHLSLLIYIVECSHFSSASTFPLEDILQLLLYADSFVSTCLRTLQCAKELVGNICCSLATDHQKYLFYVRKSWRPVTLFIFALLAAWCYSLVLWWMFLDLGLLVFVPTKGCNFPSVLLKCYDILFVCFSGKLF